jgi:hypothetical protein
MHTRRFVLSCMYLCKNCEMNSKLRRILS